MRTRFDPVGSVLIVAGCATFAAQLVWGIVLRDFLFGCFSAGLLIAGGLLHVADALQAARQAGPGTGQTTPPRSSPPPPPPRSSPTGPASP